MATPADDMTQEDALKTQLKDSRENEDLPEDCDQCRRQTGKQRSEEDEEQEGTEEEEEEGGRVLTNREVVRTTGEAKTNSEDTQGQDGGALEGERIVQVEHETITAKQLKDCKEQFTFLLKDLEARSTEGRDASKQHTECFREWKAYEGESAHTTISSQKDQQLSAHVKDFAAERSVGEREVMTTDSLEKKLGEPLTQSCGELSQLCSAAAESGCIQRREVKSVVSMSPMPCSSVKEQLSSAWARLPQQSMQRGNSRMCLTSVQGGTEAEEQRDVVTEREAHLQQIISCLIESRKQEQALWEKHYSELQETIHTSQAVVSVLQQTTCCSENADDRSRLVDLREQMTKLVHLQIKYEILEKALFGLSSENEKLQVHQETTCGVQNMLLNEERRGLEKALEEHKSQVEIMAEQLKVYESDFEKERAQREKLFAENDTLKAKNILLQQESSTVVALQQRCDGLMSEKEELLVQCMTQQGRIKELEEERNGLLEERSIFCSQLQKASEGHKIMAEQLKLHESDFEKERAQREKILAEYDTLKTKNISLQQEKNASSDEKEKLQAQLKLLEEAMRGLEKEKNGYLEEIKDVRSQLRKAAEDHTSQVEIAAQQLTVYKSDFEKERAQREKLLAENDTLKNSLQQEKDYSIVASLQQSSDEKEKLQAKLKLLEEEMRGLEKEKNGYLEEIKDVRSQLRKAAEDHMSQAERAAQQLTVYKSDFEKERAQQVKLLTEYDTLKSEKDSIVARLQQSSDEKEKLQVQLKLLEEDWRGLEKERNGYLEKINNLHFQLQKVTEENMSQVEIATQQRKLYESDFEKERAQREKLLAKYDTLQAEKETLVARLQQYEVVVGCGPSTVRSLSIDANGQHPAHPQSTSRSRSDDPQRPPPSCATPHPHPAHQSMATPMSPPHPLTTPYSTPPLTTPRATPQAMPPHNSPLQVAPSLQVTPLPRQGVCAEMCPICGRSGFRTINDLVHHSAICNDFKN